MTSKRKVKAVHPRARELEAVHKSEIIELGFENHNGSLLRKFYRDFVIDLLPDVTGNGYNIELRGGSLANRIRGKIEALDELRTILTVLGRGTD